jgi:S-formylglutathione hydrolase FrmB
MLTMNKTYFLLVFLVSLGFLLLATQVINAESKKKTNPMGTSAKKDTLLTYQYVKKTVPVKINYADSSKASILVLPGWNLKATEWCEKTKLCEQAKKQGFDLIFVEMQRSVYLKEYYPQTRADYSAYPTRSWLMDTVILPLIKAQVIDNTNPVFVLGLSTGGRGAAILALEYPAVFSGAASLSGDFNPILQKDDALMINSLGPYSKFPDLWNGDNNISKRAKEFIVPLYIGHGQQDKICPLIQSTDFVKVLKTTNPALRVVSHFPATYGHTYTYWDSEVDAVLNFFKSINRKNQ